MQFAPEVYERGAAAVARGRSPEVALNNWLSDRCMPQSSLARDLTVANQMMGEFKGIVLDELAYQGGLADKEGRTAAFIWDGVQSTFVDMFLPGSVPELVLGAAGGVDIGKGVGLAATQQPKVVSILGADVGYSLSKGLTLATDEITYTLRSPVNLDYAPGQLNSGIPLAPQNPIVRTVTGDTSATSGGRFTQVKRLCVEPLGSLIL